MDSNTLTFTDSTGSGLDFGVYSWSVGDIHIGTSGNVEAMLTGLPHNTRSVSSPGAADIVSIIESAAGQVVRSGRDSDIVGAQIASCTMDMYSIFHSAETLELIRFASDFLKGETAGNLAVTDDLCREIIATGEVLIGARQLAVARVDDRIEIAGVSHVDGGRFVFAAFDKISANGNATDLYVCSTCRSAVVLFALDGMSGDRRCLDADSVIEKFDRLKAGLPGGGTILRDFEVSEYTRLFTGGAR